MIHNRLLFINLTTGIKLSLFCFLLFFSSFSYGSMKSFSDILIEENPNSYSNNTMFEIKNMTVEHETNHLCVDVDQPVFGWQMSCVFSERGVYQSAYQIIVTDEEGKVLWNSGKVISSVSQNIKYTGEQLKPTTRYTWKLTVWDNNGEASTYDSWFETSLMTDNDIEGWNGAKWIGGDDDDIPFYSHYLPVFKLNMTFRMLKDCTSQKIGFLYGANDERLMDSNMNIYHISNEKNKSFVKMEFDLSPVCKGGKAILNVYRVGYKPGDDFNKPLKSFVVPDSLLNNTNLNSVHTFSLYSNLGFTRILLGDNLIGEVNINPLGQGGDFIAFPVVGDIGFAFDDSNGFSDVSLEVCNFRSPENRLAKINADSELLCGDNASSGKQSSYYLVNPSRNSMPMLRTDFGTEKSKKISKARLYVTSRGIYEMYINGKRVGNDYFNPGATQYNKTHLYQTFDVTDLLKDGKNAIGALLAEGWWSGGSTYTGENWNFFGDRQSLLAQLIITYYDGDKQIIVTSPDMWKYYNNGPVVYGSFFQGEVYNALKEDVVRGWTDAEYDGISRWKNAVEVRLEGNVCRTSGWNMPRVDDYSCYRLTAQYGQTVKPVKKLTSLSVEEVRPGVFVYDMGQNMVGVPEICLEGISPGTEINIRYAEVRYPDMPRYAGNEGMIMLENIRAAMSQDKYISKGGKEVFSPRFTFHGYRYLEITGIDKALPVENVSGIVLSSIDKLTASYITSNKKVNRLWENIIWSTYANFLSIPTDCPQRNERLGWAGDISVFSRTATYLADVNEFLRRYLCAMRDTQREDGRFPDVAPLGVGFGGLLWGSAGITIPWELYMQYGNVDLLSEHYDAMKKYIDYVLAKNIDCKSGILVQENVWGNLGDWLGPEDNKNDKTLMWESYFLYDLDIMSKVADVLGKEDDRIMYDSIYNRRLKFFEEMYIHKPTGKTVSSGVDGPAKGQLIDIQTSYVLPLSLDIIKDDSLKHKFAGNLVNTVKRKNIADDGSVCPPYSLMTGFIGTAWISKALSDNGYDDVAYRLLQQTTFPSWLYSVDQGATTIWERLNSYTHVDGFGENNRMNSFNHYSFGAVGGWMCAYSLGIMRDSRSPGFRHFILSPRIDPTGNMTYAEGHYDSIYGRIESSWRVNDKEIVYSFTVPANTGATFVIPVKNVASVTENALSSEASTLDKGIPGVTGYEFNDGVLTVELLSGKYSFVVRR